MGLFFGTDGIRGVPGKDLSLDLVFKIGNSLAGQIDSPKILVATDGRTTASAMMTAISCGIISGGGTVVYVGVIGTAAVSFITKEKGFDYGVVITASHNSSEFNGIKIFDKNGEKLTDEKINLIEKTLFNLNLKNSNNFGKFETNFDIINDYIDFIVSQTNKDPVGKFKVVFDCSNGATSFSARRIYERLNIDCLFINNMPNGTNINQNCGSNHLENLIESVVKNKADLGFAVDGDGDRLIAVDENGTVVDGDKILLVFAKWLKKNNQLKGNTVVGTSQTNMAIENELKQMGINFERTDVGDRFVFEKMKEKGFVLGGEQSGHIINLTKFQTGDGVLNSILLMQILTATNQKLSAAANIKTYTQKQKNIAVKNKDKIILNQELNSQIIAAKNELKENGRLVVRPSGTESVIRIMAESKEESVAEFVAEKIEKMIRDIDSKFGLCVE